MCIAISNMMLCINGHGDVERIADSNNNQLNEYYYDEYGNIKEETGTFDNPYRYAGYYYDKETNNYYLQSRYYNPEIMRFISEDTYRGNPEDPLSLNYYTYVNNNPLRYTDPDGHIPVPLITGLIGGIFNSGASIVGDLISGNDINWKKAGGAFVEGAIIGGSLGLAAPLGTAGVLSTAYLSGTVGNAANQKIVTGEVNWGQASINGLTTTVGVGTFGIGGNVTSSGARWVADYAIKGSISSMASNATYQVLTKDIKDFSFGEMAFSGAVGGVMAPVGAKATQTAINKIGPQKYTVEVNGKKVTLDKNLVDPNRVDKNTGLTNKQLMDKGLAPYGSDGKKIIVHHIDQTNKGPVTEMNSTQHASNYSKLHSNTGQNPSQINRTEFNNWRNGYWNWRSNNINYTPEMYTNVGGAMNSIFNNTLNRVPVPNK